MCRDRLQVSGGNKVGARRLAGRRCSGSVVVDVFLSVRIACVCLHTGALEEFHFAFVSLREIVCFRMLCEVSRVVSNPKEGPRDDQTDPAL